MTGKRLLIFSILATVCAIVYGQDTNALLKQKHIVVTDKEKCFSGNRHNYESLAYYAWPDEDDPTAPYIIKDGQPSPEYSHYDGQRIYLFKERVVKLNNAYLQTADSRYAECCVAQLKAWFLDAETFMAPNLDYGQFIPGKRNGKGYPGSISEAYNLFYVIDVIEQMDKSHFINKKTHKKLKKWFKEFAKWLHTSDLGKEMQSQTDNLGVMYDLLLYRIGQFTGDKKLRKQIIKEFPSYRLESHIAADGSQPLELQRTKAMMYSIYNLQHIIQLCQMAKNDGVGLYENNNKRIDAAVDYLKPFLFDNVPFPYTEIGDWEACKHEFMKLQKDLDKLNQ